MKKRRRQTVVTAAKSNLFEMEWPRGSGRIQAFPEVDRAAWFTADEARHKLVETQAVFVDRLARALAAGAGGDHAEDER